MLLASPLTPNSYVELTLLYGNVFHRKFQYLPHQKRLNQKIRENATDQYY